MTDLGRDALGPAVRADREAGIYRADGLPEFATMLEAWQRGTRRSSLRQFAAICPGEQSHTLAEVYPGGIVFTRYYVHTDGDNVVLLDEDREADEQRGRVRVGRGPAAALLSEISRPVTGTSLKDWDPAVTSYLNGRHRLHLRCCMHVDLDVKWLRNAVVAGRRRRAVVPGDMLQTNHYDDTLDD